MTFRRPSRILLSLVLTCAALVTLDVWSIAAAPAASAATSVVAHLGSRGSTVVTIQRAVHSLPDGFYGPKTAAAVRAWQQAHHLSVTGVVDRLTWSALKPKAPVAAPQLFGNDVSWPQCPKGTGIPTRRGEGKSMPSATTKFVVIGTTNGPAFYANPCLDSQTAWAKSHHVYVATYAMTTYPSTAQLAAYGLAGPYEGTSLLTKLANTGYAQARFNVASMRAAGLVSPFMWVDVEPYRVAPWSKSRARNKAVVDGVLRGYRAAGLKVGVYSTPYLWNTVVGSARYGLPEWRTAGPRSKTTAQARCSGLSFQGGQAVLAQWTSKAADYDITCPGYGSQASLAAHFHKY